MVKKKILIICMVLVIPPLPLAGIVSQRSGNRIISGNSHAKFIHPVEAKTTYEKAIQALNSGTGLDFQSGKPHYYYTFKVNLLPSGTKDGFGWQYKPGFLNDSFVSAANPAKRGAELEENLVGLGWTIQGGKDLQSFIAEATSKREKEVANLQKTALDCGEKRYCLEYKEQQLAEINYKPLDVRFYLTHNPYTLYLNYEIYPADETAKLDARLVYGCSKPSDEYCRK
ncbi:hypothetical protein KA531_02025 [Candidatus Saccharibacteria bacterium]|nr:hypothetical protein [Candidatus Saccharibacteria bacterium]